MSLPSLKYFPPSAHQAARLRHIVPDRLIQLFEIITWNTRIHVMLRVPIHMPIEKLEHRVQRDRPHAFAKVSYILLQPTMLRQAKKIGQPIGGEIEQCENYRQNPKPGDKSLHNTAP